MTILFPGQRSRVRQSGGQGIQSPSAPRERPVSDRFFIQVFSMRHARLLAEDDGPRSARIVQDYPHAPTEHELAGTISRFLGRPVVIDDMPQTQKGEWEVVIGRAPQPQHAVRVADRSAPWVEQKRAAKVSIKAAAASSQIAAKPAMSYVERESRIRFWMQLLATPFVLALFAVVVLGIIYVSTKMFHIRW